MFFKRILALTIKEFHQLKRDKKLYPLLFIVPIIQLVVIGYAADFDIKNNPTGILDQDRTQMSRQFVEAFSQNEYFNIVYQAESRQQLTRLMDEGRIRVGIDIPHDFQKKLKKGTSSPVQIFIDGTESNSAVVALIYAGIIAERFSSDLILKHIDSAAFNAGDFLGSWRRDIGKSAIIEDQVRIWYNPELLSTYFFIPGVISMLLLVVTQGLTTMSIMKEKEAGTLEQLFSTPASTVQIILGKIVPYIIIGLFDVAFIVTAGVLIFQVPIKGSLLLLFAFAFLFLFTTLGLGIFISTVTRTVEQAMIAAFFLVLVMILLSGIIFPIENMPAFFRHMTHLMPLRYFATIVRSIFLKGVGIDVLWDQGMWLMILGLVIFIASVIMFKKKV